MSKPAITITDARIVSITPFERENWHVNLKYPERFVCITFECPAGVYVFFTRKHTPFAEACRYGYGRNPQEKYTVSGKHKRVQNYADLDGQVVLTNGKFGVYAFQAEQAKRQAKIEARKAKLYGTTT